MAALAEDTGITQVEEIDNEEVADLFDDLQPVEGETSTELEGFGIPNIQTNDIEETFDALQTERIDTEIPSEHIVLPAQYLLEGLSKLARVESTEEEREIILELLVLDATEP